MSISCVMNRRSVREYTDEKVSDDMIREMLKAGMYAPSARNSQPWEFVVITERDKLDELSGGAPYWGMLKKAPLSIIVLANINGYKSSTVDFFIQDCAACVENILVTAEGLGLGGVWLGCYPAEDRVDYVTNMLKLPDNVYPLAVLSIGHPAVHPEPHGFFDEEKVHWEKY